MELLVTIVIALIVVGLLLWAADSLPIDAAIKQIIRVVVIVAVVLWLLGAVTGYMPPIWHYRHG